MRTKKTAIIKNITYKSICVKKSNAYRAICDFWMARLKRQFTVKTIKLPWILIIIDVTKKLAARIAPSGKPKFDNVRYCALIDR